MLKISTSSISSIIHFLSGSVDFSKICNPLRLLHPPRLFDTVEWKFEYIMNLVGILNWIECKIRQNTAYSIRQLIFVQLI